jgi:hypothetical protein
VIKRDLMALIVLAIFGITAVTIVITLTIGIILSPQLLFALAVILMVNALCLLIIAMFAEPKKQLEVSQ